MQLTSSPTSPSATREKVTIQAIERDHDPPDHVITSSIMGVGTTRGTSAVKWGMARSIIWAWILTIPISALIGYVSFSLIHHILP
jgi:hypothetical protein